ncbi:uncharacterized protein LOC127291335 [Leptopilina boulardi]|uniref:uncharacterized protein LOC127291335 n=1 Tax=Leptopilina boulardi TaxID=63433 RepID=UPI0021F64C7C|nr:uncharacterized protein LOC127291335 [Leptopilina boulardi]
MPNQYKRKSDNIRGNWSEESLKTAIDAVKIKGMSVLAASKTYGIPRKTLERRIKNNNDKKGPLGPSSIFGIENERKLALHIIEMQKKGFSLTKTDVRIIAYSFAEHLSLKHRFNKEERKAGYDWLNLFLIRNKDIKLKKSGRVSLAEDKAVNELE